MIHRTTAIGETRKGTSGPATVRCRRPGGSHSAAGIALRICLIACTLVPWSHAGVVIAGNKLVPEPCQDEFPAWSSHLVDSGADSGSSVSHAARALGLGESAFSTTLSPFTLDLLANNSPPWPASPAGKDETTPDDPHPPAAIEMNPHSPPSPLGNSAASNAKWFGLLGAILLLVRISSRR